MLFLTIQKVAFALPAWPVKRVYPGKAVVQRLPVPGFENHEII